MAATSGTSQSPGSVGALVQVAAPHVALAPHVAPAPRGAQVLHAAASLVQAAAPHVAGELAPHELVRLIRRAAVPIAVAAQLEALLQALAAPAAPQGV